LFIPPNNPIFASFFAGRTDDNSIDQEQARGSSSTMPYAAATRTSPEQHSRVVTNGRAAVACAGHAGVPAEVARHHEHTVAAGQCCSVMMRSIAAPVDAVWSLVRRFDQPQGYKGFIRSCHLVDGDGIEVGSVRELEVVTGLPAQNSRERLEIRDDERRVIGFRILGGDHRLANYRSVTTVHEAASQNGGGPLTMVVESYVVDVPQGNTVEETHIFVDTIVRCNLQSLERTVLRQQAMAAAPHNNHNHN